MSDEIQFASSDDLTFEWPPKNKKSKGKKPYVAKGLTPEQRDELKTLRKARELARRWLAEDINDDVIIMDIINCLLGDK